MSYGDGIPVRHPLPKLEEAIGTIPHTKETHKDVPDRPPGAAMHDLGSRGPHRKANRGRDQQSLATH